MMQWIQISDGVLMMGWTQSSDGGTQISGVDTD